MSFIMDMKLREYTPRNILSMEQRIKVIKTYRRIPNYQRLANHFGCSTKQIKNIIANKDELLRYYKNMRTNKLTDEISIRRREKIDFLGKVVYEFLLRALFLRMPIGTTIIRQKAFEVKEAIAIENFTPNNAWLQDFKATYNRLDLTEMKEQLPSDMDKRRSVKCIDIIEYVSQQEREERHKQVAEDENCNSVWKNECSMSGSEWSMRMEAHEVYYGNEDDVDVADMENGAIRECDSVKNVNSASAYDEPIVVNLDSEDEESAACSLAKSASANSGPNDGSSALKPASLPPFPDIHSYPEAMRHLRVLEDFAMIEENYRAIGLITQLEQIFKNPPKLKSISH